MADLSNTQVLQRRAQIRQKASEDRFDDALKDIEGLYLNSTPELRLELEVERQSIVQQRVRRENELGSAIREGLDAEMSDFDQLAGLLAKLEPINEAKAQVLRKQYTQKVEAAAKAKVEADLREEFATTQRTTFSSIAAQTLAYKARQNVDKYPDLPALAKLLQEIEAWRDKQNEQVGRLSTASMSNDFGTILEDLQAAKRGGKKTLPVFEWGLLNGQRMLVEAGYAAADEALQKLDNLQATYQNDKAR